MDPLYDALLGQLAVDAGLLTQDQLAECIRVRESTGRPLGAILLEKGYLTDESLEKLLEARAEASYLGLFPLEVRKRRTTEMFAAAPPAEAPPVQEAKPATEEIQEVQPVFPGVEEKEKPTPAEELIPAAQAGEIEGEFISDTPLPEVPEGVPVAPFVDASRDVKPPGEGPTERLVPNVAAIPDIAQDERSFGLLLTECGLLNERRIEECLTAQRAIGAHGIRLRLGEILVRKGVASPLQIRDVLRLQNVVLLHCPECLVNYNVHGFGLGKKASCPRCETRLIVPVATAIDAVDTMTLGQVDTTEHPPVETFGRYLLFEELGTGQLGITYKAWDTRTGRLVALKRLCPIDPVVANDVDRIAEGAKAAIGLRHASIAEVFEVGDVEGDRYVAAKFIEGTPLSKLIHATNLSVEPPVQLTPRNIAEIARQVAEAISAAHHSDVLHYDLKPSNIILDPDGTPHVTDFGVAIDRRPSLGDNADRWQRPILGTFPYIAPECTLEEAPIGPAADVFSLGVVMYESLTGKVPFSGESPEQVLHAVTSVDPEPPSKWALNLPRDLERIVMKAIARDPGERYADGAALAADLARFVAGETLEVEEPMEVEPVEERPRPRPSAKPVSERRPLRPEPLEEVLPISTPPSRGKGRLVAVVLVLALIGGGVWAWLGPVQNHLLRKAGDEALSAGNLDLALEKYKALEARGVTDPELATKRQECDRRIAERKAAEEAVAKKQAAQEALGKARGALDAARSEMRAAVTEPAPQRVTEGVEKAREAARLAEQAFVDDTELVDALIIRVQALALVGDATAARAAAEKVPASDGRRAGAIPSLVAVELAPLLAARGPLKELVSPAKGVEFWRKLPEPATASYRKQKEAIRALLSELTEPGDLARPLSAGLAALMDGNAKTAVTELSTVVAAVPEEASFQLALAVACLGTGDKEAALRASDAALALRANDAMALWARSAALALLGRPEAAEVRGRAIEADRKLGHPQLDAAAAHLAAGRATDALDAAREVLVDREGDPRALLLSARARRASGQADAALVEIDQALSAVPEFHAARVLRGDLLAALGRMDEAVKELEGCFTKEPEDLEAALSLGRALVARRDAERAIPILNRVVKDAADWPEPLGLRAEARLLAKDLDGALSDASAALAKDPTQDRAVRVKALVRLAKGEGAMVESDLSAAIEKFPRDVELLKARAQIRKVTGNLDAAIYDLTIAIGIAPEDASLLLERARCYRVAGKPAEALKDLDAAAAGGSAGLEVTLERSVLREESGDLDGALEDATEAVRRDSGSALAHALRARLLTAIGQAAVAGQDAEEGVRLDASCVEAWEARSLVREALGELQGAKEDIDKAIELDASLDRLYPTRARIRRATGEVAGAVADEERSAQAFRAAASKLLEDARTKADEEDFQGASSLATRAAWIDPGNVSAWRDRGFYRMKAGEGTGALEDLDRALTIDPKNADVLSQRAAVKKSLKDYAGAVEDWTAALEIDAGRIEDRIARAGAYRSLGQKEKALEEVNAALTEKPDAVEGLRLRAILKNTARDYAGAIEDALRAIDVGGADAWTYYQLGYAYDASAKRQEAVDAFTQAIHAKADYADAYSHRGWVQLALGNVAASRDDQLEAVKHNPNHAWAHFRLSAVYASESAKGAASPLAADGDLVARSLAELAKAVDSGFSSKSYLEATKYFEPIRAQPEYQQLLSRLK